MKHSPANHNNHHAINILILWMLLLLSDERSRAAPDAGGKNVIELHNEKVIKLKKALFTGVASSLTVQCEFNISSITEKNESPDIYIPFDKRWVKVISAKESHLTNESIASWRILLGTFAEQLNTPNVNNIMKPDYFISITLKDSSVLRFFLDSNSKNLALIYDEYSYDIFSLSTEEMWAEARKLFKLP